MFKSCRRYLHVIRTEIFRQRVFLKQINNRRILEFHHLVRFWRILACHTYGVEYQKPRETRNVSRSKWQTRGTSTRITSQNRFGVNILNAIEIRSDRKAVHGIYWTRTYVGVGIVRRSANRQFRDLQVAENRRASKKQMDDQELVPHFLGYQGKKVVTGNGKKHTELSRQLNL